MSDRQERNSADYPYGKQCIEWFIDGRIALDCSNDPRGYKDMMDILTLYDVIWAGCTPANESKYDRSAPFIWNYHKCDWSSNGRAMTKASYFETFLEQAPGIIRMTAQEMLEQIRLDNAQIVPLNLGFLYNE